MRLPIVAMFCMPLAACAAASEPLDLSGYKLTFDEEFNTRSISQEGSTTTWADIRPWTRYDRNSDIGFGGTSFLDPASGYDPFKVSGGALTITAQPYTVRWGYPGSWQSGLLLSRRFAQRGGYWEVRARFSQAPGSWDAPLWLLPVDTVKKAGSSSWQEADFEHYGFDPPTMYTALHTTDNSAGQTQYAYRIPTAGWHAYGMLWSASTLCYYTDGMKVGCVAVPSDYTGPMYPVIDLARESKPGASATPFTMDIDYVRVFSAAHDVVAVEQDKVSAPDNADPGLYKAGALSGTRTGQP